MIASFDGIKGNIIFLMINLNQYLGGRGIFRVRDHFIKLC